MDIVQATILGLIQGVTEFLPISSSGHLVLVPKIFGWAEEQPLEFDAVLHLATLIAVLFYFRSDIIILLKSMFYKKPKNKYYKRLGWVIVVATIPAIIIGFILKCAPENPLRNIHIITINLIGWAIVMFLIDSAMKIKKNIKSVEKVGWRQGIYVGLAQAFALMPGTSRSGISITAGLAEGLNRSTAARFAFLLGIPAITAAGTVSLIDILTNPSLNVGLVPLIFGFITAMISGYFAIHFLIKFLEKYSLNIFVLYRLVFGLILIILFW